MAKLFKVTLLIQTDEDPVGWICENVADVLEDGEELLRFTCEETTLLAELNL